MKKTTLQNRIRLALSNSGLSKTDLWKGCGVSSSTVTTWFNGRNKSITGTNLINASKVLGVNPNWLANGIGNMHSAAENFQNLSFPIINQTELTKKLTSLSSIEINLSWLEHELSGVSQEELNLFIVSDNAMSPSLEVGDLILLDTSIRSFSHDGVYVIKHNSHFFIRRMLLQIDGAILIKCDNPDYQNQVINPGEKQPEVSGQAIWAWSQKKI